MSDKVHAPWSDEQVAALDRWQRSECVHPFTCGDRDGHPWNEKYGDYGPLIPTNAGWVCEHCDYTQDWAHEMMFDHVPMTYREMFSNATDQPLPDHEDTTAAYNEAVEEGAFDDRPEGWIR